MTRNADGMVKQGALARVWEAIAAEGFERSGERTPRAELTLVIKRLNDEILEVPMICRLDTAEEVGIYEAGGGLQRFEQDFLQRGCNYSLNNKNGLRSSPFLFH